MLAKWLRVASILRMGRFSGSALGVGLAIGVVIGVILDNVGAGIGIGLALAIAMGWTRRKPPKYLAVAQRFAPLSKNLAPHSAQPVKNTNYPQVC